MADSPDRETARSLTTLGGVEPPITVATVWTASCHSPPTSSAETTWKPSKRAAPTRTHYRVDPPGASLQTSDIRKLCEAPGAIREPYGAVNGTSPRFMTKSPITKSP